MKVESFIRDLQWAKLELWIKENPKLITAGALSSALSLPSGRADAVDRSVKSYMMKEKLKLEAGLPILATLNADLRADLEKRYFKSWFSNYGLDIKFVHVSYGFRLPVATRQGGITDPTSGASVVNADISRDDVDLGFYFKNTLDLFGLNNKLMPSLRLDYFTQSHQVLLAPRLADRYSFSDSLWLKGAAGIYYQPPQPQEVDVACFLRSRHSR